MIKYQIKCFNKKCVSNYENICRNLYANLAVCEDKITKEKKNARKKFSKNQ